MRKKTLAIGLFADRMDVMVVHGDRIQSGQRIGLALSTESAQWTTGVRETAARLRSAIEQLNAEGSDAIVFYRSPTECSEYAALKMQTVGEALRAAELSCADSLACPTDAAVIKAMMIGQDKKGSEPQSHVIATADQQDALTAISDLIESVGLNFVSATPIDAVIMAKVASSALTNKEWQAGYLYLGEHRSFFVIAGEEQLLFARPISLGIHAMITSLTRPFRPNPGADPIELTLTEAREIVHKYGFPDRSTIVHGKLKLTGWQLIPLLQPVLQRFIVELRQSLRFGLPEESRTEIKLIISGPGSAIPNFSKVIGDEIGVPSEADKEYAEYNYLEVDSTGSEMYDAIENLNTAEQLGLLPHHVTRERESSQLRRWMWTGAAASLMLVAVDAFRLHYKVSTLSNDIEKLTSEAQSAQQLQTVSERMFAAITAMNEVDKHVAQTTGGYVDIEACLHELSRLTPGDVRLTAVSFLNSNQTTTGRLSGYARDSKTSSAQMQLEPFIEKLRTSPLFDQVVLTNVQAASHREKTGQRFDAKFAVVSMPEIPEPEAVAAVDDGEGS